MKRSAKVAAVIRKETGLMTKQEIDENKAEVEAAMLDELKRWPATKRHRCFKSHWPSKGHITSNGRRSKTKFVYMMCNIQDGISLRDRTKNTTFKGVVAVWLRG